MSSLYLDNKDPNILHIYTDGSLRPNGCASCAFLIYNHRSKSIIKMAKYAFRGKTINQMELMAIKLALEESGSRNVIIYTDSAYSIGALGLYRKSWALNNWMTKLNEPVKNADLIKEIGALLDAKRFTRFVKVKGHSGDLF